VCISCENKEFDYSGVYLEKLKKTREILNDDNWSTGKNLKLFPAQHFSVA